MLSCVIEVQIVTKLRTAYLLVALAGGCGGESPAVPPIPSPHFESERRYQHALFTTPEQCANIQAAGANCYQWATFEPSGKAELVVTDIVHVTTYSITGNYLSALLEAEAGEGSSVEFTVSADLATLEVVGTEEVWQHVDSFGFD